MKVFLSNYAENGQRHFIVDPVTHQKKKPGFVLYADHCDEEISDKDGKLLLKQNPVALSKKPLSKDKVKAAEDFQKQEFSMPRGFTMSQLLATATTEELEIALKMRKADGGEVPGNLPQTAKSISNELPDFVIDEFVEETVKKIANMNEAEFKALKPKEITSLGADLGVKIPSVGIKKVDALASLEERAKTLASRIKAPGSSDDYEEE